MFDYYAMPADWPGRQDASNEPWQERATHVENRLHADIVTAMSGRFDRRYFIPYVQLHEFEALAFADIVALASVVSPLTKKLSEKTLTMKFTEILEEAGHPEAIDDGFETCPSRRIGRIVPAYKKRAQGPIITARIGLPVLRERCDHFASWLNRLESLGTQSNP
jgi:hypothetical protein